ncbi:hypothetical protein [Marinobacterium ramblicola]|uniref:hypothetical protein n=1 Tax=Marinobacterium ramblicola TaxID=2849041 RepID=UPI001FE974F4|nr:hypothetical protein [Marinobacterium ramblicola]
MQAGWHPLSYPFDTTARIMRERGLDNGYARALETGLWPSTDVLPGVERMQAGQSISPIRLSIR